MLVVFRVDASLKVGTGHVMRCLTLADRLSDHGAICVFISRSYPGNLIQYIMSRGYHVDVIPVGSFSSSDREIVHHARQLAHAPWLGVTQQQDLEACLPILNNWQPDWLIVDHYALDSSWEEPLHSYCRHSMAIDDLADRTHSCDLLLDQSLGRRESDYAMLVSDRCTRLIGPSYALLRPEFVKWRPYSLNRRTKKPYLRHLLITMGGVDKDNVTGRVLESIARNRSVGDARITVIMGIHAPWVEQIRTLAATMPHATKVLCGVSDMARLMAESDLVIGAAGATVWEQCCLGVPAILIVLADNQRSNAEALERIGAAMYMDAAEIEYKLPAMLNGVSLAERLLSLSGQGQSVVDGLGVDRATSEIIEWG